MRRAGLLVVILVGLVLAARTGPALGASLTHWMPLREVASQAYIDAAGTALPRYQWHTISDVRGACLVVLTDTDTGAFALTAVPLDACH